MGVVQLGANPAAGAMSLTPLTVWRKRSTTMLPSRYSGSMGIVFRSAESCSAAAKAEAAPPSFVRNAMLLSFSWPVLSPASGALVVYWVWPRHAVLSFFFSPTDYRFFCRMAVRDFFLSFAEVLASCPFLVTVLRFFFRFNYMVLVLISCHLITGH
jgi:hypothetical protein